MNAITIIGAVEYLAVGVLFLVLWIRFHKANGSIGSRFLKLSTLCLAILSLSVFATRVGVDVLHVLSDIHRQAINATVWGLLVVVGVYLLDATKGHK